MQLSGRDGKGGLTLVDFVFLDGFDVSEFVVGSVLWSAQDADDAEQKQGRDEADREDHGNPASSSHSSDSLVLGFRAIGPILAGEIDEDQGEDGYDRDPSYAETGDHVGLRVFGSEQVANVAGGVELRIAE